MGKGTIINHIADGQYNVTLDIDDTRAQQTIITLDAAILKYNTIITEAQATKGTAWAMYDSARSKFNVILNQYLSGTATREQVIAATADMNAKYRLYVEYDRAWWHAQLKQKSLQKQKEYIENKLAENPAPTVQAWCADLTEDLTGSVGTIEIPNERTNDIQVRPGYGGAAIYSAPRDGQLQQVVSSTAAGVYYNYAMFPGWQKWKPTYRVGKITAKPTDDTADVLLDSATSTAQSLDVNVSNTLSDVPIVYMDCNGAVFEIDDRVVVEFISQDHTNPRVIGFETNPKACMLDLISIPSDSYGLPYAKINIHDKLTGTIQQSCVPLGIIYSNNWWTGCTFDGTYFMAYNETAKKIYRFNGKKVGDDICTSIQYWDLSAYNWRWGLAWTGSGTQIVTRDSVTNNIEVFTLLGAHLVTLDLSYSLPYVGYPIRCMCWDFAEDNLIVGGFDAVAGATKIRKFRGLTTVLVDEITMSISGPSLMGLTMQGQNLITWFEYNIVDPNESKIRLHDGFSSTILQTEIYAPANLNAFDSIVYPKNG